MYGATGYVDMSAPRYVNAALRFAKNCGGIDQEFYPGSFAYTVNGPELVTSFNDTAQLVILKKNCTRVELNCGYVKAADSSASNKVNSDTLMLTFSTSKAIIAYGLMHLQSNNRFNWTDTVASIWPEFAQNGKSEITVQQLFSNAAALPYIDPVTMDDISLQSNFTKLKTLLEQAICAYGSSNDETKAVYGYSPIVAGWYAEFFSTYVDIYNRRLSEYITQEMTSHSGGNIYFGIPTNRTDLKNKTADLGFGVFAPATCTYLQKSNAALLDPNSLQSKALYNPAILALNPLIVNTDAGQNILLPAGICFTSSKAFAAFVRYALNVIPTSSLQEGYRIVSNQTDASTYGFSAFTVSGLLGKTELFSYCKNKECVGHNGASGGMFFHNPKSDEIFVYSTSVYSPADCDSTTPYNTRSVYEAFMN